jgi:hypothetical protein
MPKTTRPIWKVNLRPRRSDAEPERSAGLRQQAYKHRQPIEDQPALHEDRAAAGSVWGWFTEPLLSFGEHASRHSRRRLTVLLQQPLELAAANRSCHETVSTLPGIRRRSLPIAASTFHVAQGRKKAGALSKPAVSNATSSAPVDPSGRSPGFWHCRAAQAGC